MTKLSLDMNFKIFERKNMKDIGIKVEFGDI